MFTPESIIDTFQGTKKSLTNAVFQDKTLNKAAHDYIDSQTAFAKMLVRNTVEVTRYSVESISSKLFSKTDTK